MLAAAWLLVAALAGCHANDVASGSRGVLSVSEVLLAAETLEGRTVTLEAEIRIDGHTMFLVDVDDAGKRLDLDIEGELAWSETVMNIGRMLVEDAGRERPLGVVAKMTGTFSARSGSPTLLVSNIEDLRSGRPAGPAH
jgi:hypothetical protein